jgi:hypothetical protein
LALAVGAPAYGCARPFIVVDINIEFSLATLHGRSWQRIWRFNAQLDTHMWYLYHPETVLLLPNNIFVVGGMAEECVRCKM